MFYYDVMKKKRREAYRSISQTKVSEAFNVFVDEYLNFSPELAEWSKKYIVELKNKDINDAVFSQERRLVNKETLEKKAARLRTMLRDEQITDEEYKTDLAALQATYGVPQAQTAKVDWFKEMNDIVDLTQSAKDIFDSDDFEEKRGIMAKLGSNLVWNEKTLNVYNKKSIQKLVEGIKEIKQKHREFEPKNFLANKEEKEKTELVNSVFSRMLPRQGSNLRPIDYTCPKIA